MSFPLINKQPMRQINIPDLSGGINLRDAIYSVNDNQLCDCKNVWFKDGMLKTRPGSRKGSNIATLYSKDYEGDYENKEWEIYRTVGGVTYKLHSVASNCFGTNESGTLENYEGTKFYFVPDTKENERAEVNELPSLDFWLEGFVTECDGVIYVFASEYAMESNGKVYKLTGSGTTDSPYMWQKLENTDLYVPTVLTDCKCGTPIRAKNFSSAPGEAYNKLNDLYKIEYSTVNLDLLSASDESSYHYMCYYAPVVGVTKDNFYEAEVRQKIVDYFTVEITYASDNGVKTVKHSLSFTDTANAYNTYPDIMYEVEPNTEGAKTEDNLFLKAYLIPDGGVNVSFYRDATYSADGLKTVKASDYSRNNMVITVPCIEDGTTKREIFESDIVTWYGGEASGIFGGTRLFLAGGAKNKVIWSDLNNPLYFPEDCDMDVGNKDEMITAFGKQNEQLVIFKEHSIWGSNYVFNSNITGEALINQMVVNYEANAAYFPLIQLHPQIGCRVPKSVQLCRNRLVWADSNGKVYTLVSQSQYNERNVYELSDMIEKKLKACDKEELTNAFSADYEGHYILCVGNQLFAMNYNCYGYTHCYSYSKTEDGQKLIPWWCFEISLTETEAVEGIFSINQNLYYLLSDTDQKHNTLGGEVWKPHNFSIYCFDDNMTTDEGKEIQSVIETKCFSFGTFSYTKHIAALNLALNGSGDIRITYISDKPELVSEEIFSLYSDETEIGSPSYMQNILFRPNMRFTALFGVRLEADNGIAVGPISLNYRLLGGNN